MATDVNVGLKSLMLISGGHFQYALPIKEHRKNMLRVDIEESALPYFRQNSEGGSRTVYKECDIMFGTTGRNNDTKADKLINTLNVLHVNTDSKSGIGRWN